MIEIKNLPFAYQGRDEPTLIPQEFPVLGKITGGLYVYKEGFLYGLIQGLRFSAMTASGLLL